MKCADCTFMVQKTPPLSQLNLFPLSPTELNHPAVTRCLPLTANELVAAPLHPMLSFFLFIYLFRLRHSRMAPLSFFFFEFSRSKQATGQTCHCPCHRQ